MRPFFPKTLLVIAAIPLAMSAYWIHDEPTPEVRSAPRSHATSWTNAPHPEIDAYEVGAFLDAQARQQWIDAELARIAAEEAQRAAEAAQKASQRASGPGGPDGSGPGGVTVGECTGFAIPDYIIMRESGGNPSAYNPSGAYGCAQTLLSHYSPGHTCAGLDPYTIDGQRECVWRLSNGGTNLAPWAATR